MLKLSELKDIQTIRIELKDRILKGYSNSDVTHQSQDWIEFTQAVWKRQSLLYEVGFPCFEVGRFFEFKGLYLFEEFSKGAKPYTEEKLPLKERKRIMEHSYFDYDKIKDYHPLFNRMEGDIIDCKNQVIFPKDCLLIYKNKCCFKDMAMLDLCNCQQWFYNFIKNWELGDKVTFVEINTELNRIKNDEKEMKKWKNLSLVENVKRKMVHLFRKDISLDPKDLQKNVLTMLNGEKNVN